MDYNKIAVKESKGVKKGKPAGVTRREEKLIQGDLPIIEFRKKRAELKGEDRHDA